METSLVNRRKELLGHESFHYLKCSHYKVKSRALCELQKVVCVAEIQVLKIK